MSPSFITYSLPSLLTSPFSLAAAILPQAIRRVLPTLGSEAITLIKDTSLIYVLAVTEIMKRTKELANQYYNITPYICAIIIYLVLSLAVDRLFKNAEKKNKIRI